MELDVLKIWPDWKAVKVLGEGSFGKVYEIVRSNFGIEEHCALKVISIPSSDAELQSMKNEGMDDESVTEYFKGLVEEFVQEIALMSKLKGNVNVVGYEDYAVIEHEDSVGWDIVIRMELLTALPAYIREKSFSTDDVINMAIDVCNALEVCHEHKIIHRDIKPDNIFVSKKGEYKLGDFGVARTIEKTVSGLSKKGTYTYMAPEVYKGEPYGTNVDLYSLGIVMYKLLNNNREPFLPPHPEVVKYNDKNNALVRRLGGEVMPPPTNSNEYLNKIILKACSFKSWDRYKLPSQMKSDLNAVKGLMAKGMKPVLTAGHMMTSRNTTQGQNMNMTQQTSGSYYNSTQVKTSTNGTAYVFGTNSQSINRNQTNYNQQNSNRTNYNQTNSNHTNHNRTNYNQTNYNRNTYNPAYSNQSASVENKGPRTAAIILGWIGAMIWMAIWGASKVGLLFVMAIGATFVMFLLSLPKLEEHTKVLAIFLLIFSVLTINILGVIASIIFLKTSGNKKR